MRCVDLGESFLSKQIISYSNEYLLAKFGLDTAENEPFQVCPPFRPRTAMDLSHRLRSGPLPEEVLAAERTHQAVKTRQ